MSISFPTGLRGHALDGGRCKSGTGSFAPKVCDDSGPVAAGDNHGEMPLRTGVWDSGSQPTPKLGTSLVPPSGRSGISTKTLLARSQFSGRLFSFSSTPFHVLRIKSSGRASLPYLSLLERDCSCSRQSFRILKSFVFSLLRGDGSQE